jgi:SAM-dependent methyltransferase
MKTKDKDYSDYLVNEQISRWKKLLDVQAPYSWHLRRIIQGFTLDIGCGIGRNLMHLNGKGIGIDHNKHALDIARKRGLEAYLPEDFNLTCYNRPGCFDSLLFSHVAEHMNYDEVIQLLENYINLLRPQGQLIIFTPQEAGFRSDPTHVEFMNFLKLREIAKYFGTKSTAEYSFPFPRLLGHVFPYNEFVSISQK